MFKNQHFKTLFITLLLLLVTSAFTNINAQDDLKKETISEKKFERKIKKKSAVLIDVRTAEEYNSGHIPGALNMDVQKDDFTQQVEKLDITKTYYLYCRTGKRSAKAVHILQQKGFEKVYHLQGGYSAWKGAKEQ